MNAMSGFMMPHEDGSADFFPCPVDVPTDGAQRIASIRRVVDEKAFRLVDDVLVDLFSASAIVAVYDGLNEVNKANFAALDVARMGTIAFKLLKGK